jgi:hypothetical protein
LQKHCSYRGRISLTTNTWSLRNYKEFTAVTVHWIDREWVQHSTIIDIVELKEPIHSGEYLSDELVAITDNFRVTQAVFTITRDNAAANDVMLNNFEAETQRERLSAPDWLEQP